MALVNMSKFEDGRVHFRNSGMKKINAEMHIWNA